MNSVFRFSFVSLATSQDRFKGRGYVISRSFYLSFAVAHPFFAPIGAMFHDPIEQCLFETDVFAGFLALDPLVLQDFCTLGEEFLVENRISNELRSIFF